MLSHRVVVVSTAVVVCGLVATVGPDRPTASSVVSPHTALAMTEAAAQPGACRFSVADQGAFAIQSTAWIVADGRRSDADRFAATFSWKVVAQEAPGLWEIRGQLSDVELKQDLSLPEERILHPIDAPFSFGIDEACRMTGFGFDPRWSVRARRFVAAVMLTYEFVLPEDRGVAEWTASQSDGLGEYAARYERTAQGAVRRRKLAYHPHPLAEAVGLALTMSDAEGTVVPAESGPWWQSVHGEERATVRVQRMLRADLVRTYQMSRDNDRYAAPALAGRLDWQDVFAMVAGR